jgi:predicted DNA-binding WGR domain protein
MSLLPIPYFQAYLQLKDVSKNSYKHYYVAVVQEDSHAFVVHTAYGRIGSSPRENEKVFGIKSSAVVHAEKIHNSKVVKGYVEEDYDVAVEPVPVWWNSGWKPTTGISFAKSFQAVKKVKKLEKPKKPPKKFKMGRKNAPWQF